MKKLFALVLSVCMLASLCCVSAGAEEGKVLNIYCWNTEFQGRFVNYFENAGLLPADVTVNWIITPSDNGAYQKALDEALLAQQDAAQDNRIDLFLVEADYALKYVDTDYALDVKADIGLTDADLSGQYKYTQDIVTDSQGKLKGVTWQATPGLFAYRRSIAKDVFGTDDPAEIQKLLATWDDFDKAAEQVAAKGYKMLSGYDDSYRTFSNNVTTPWVVDGKIAIDDNLWKWVDQTKDYTDKGYNNKTILWAPEWQADQGPAGKVFGFFYSTWGINFTLLNNSLADQTKPKEAGNGIYGDYAVCEGPQSYYWGGTWLCAAAGTDNAELIKSIMYTLTCDAKTLKQITLDTEDYTNSVDGMNEIANDPSYGSAFLGGQNHIALFAAAAPKIDMSRITPYDQLCNENFQTAFHDYFNGTVDKEAALANFYTAILEAYPELSK